MGSKRQSNIVFGYEAGEWETSTARHLNATKDSIKYHGASHFTVNVNPDNKTVHWGLGDDKTEYTTSNKLPDPRHGNNQRVKIHTCKDKRQANIIFGYDSTDYDWKKSTSKEELNSYTAKYVESKKNAVLPDSANPYKKNIVWGHDKPKLISQTKSAFVDHKHVGKKSGEKETIRKFVAELKQSAVSFGNDEADYTRTNLLPKHDIAKDYKKMPPPCQKSSIVFGYSANSYETTSNNFFHVDMPHTEDDDDY